jgi:hypothetical protein
MTIASSAYTDAMAAASAAFQPACQVSFASAMAAFSSGDAYSCCCADNVS